MLRIIFIILIIFILILIYINFNLQKQKFSNKVKSVNNTNVDKKALAILIASIQRQKNLYLTHTTTNSLDLKDIKIKSAIIGKNGRNLQAFTKLCGVDLIFNDKESKVTISGFNPLRRKIAINTLKELIKNKKINISTIEDEVKRQKNNINKFILEKGNDVVKTLKINDFNKSVIEKIGVLHFRYSYTQNVLSHSIECAKIAQALAIELGANSQIALKAGLLHDIGKALDIDQSGTHVELGAKFAKDNGLSDEIVNTILSHHGDYETKYLEAKLVQIADSISASRPGARIKTQYDLFTRVKKMEQLASAFDEVKEAFVIKAGKELRVIVKPQAKNIDIALLGKKIQKTLSTKMQFPGKIKITIVKENSYVIDAYQEK